MTNALSLPSVALSDVIKYKQKPSHNGLDACRLLRLTTYFLLEFFEIIHTTHIFKYFLTSAYLSAHVYFIF